MTVRFAIWPWKPGQMSAWLQGNVVHRHFLKSKVNEHVSWYSWDFSSSAGFRNWVGNEDQLLVSHITYPYLWTRTKISQEVVVLYIGVVSRLWVGTLTMHFARQTLPTNVPRRVWHFTDRDRTHRRQGHTRVNPGPENQPQNRSALFFHTLYTFIWLVVSNMFFFHNIWDNPSHCYFSEGLKPPTSHSLWIHCLSSSLMLSQENPCMVIVKRYCQNQHVGYAKLKAHGKRRWPI